MEAKCDDGSAWRFDQEGAFPRDGALKITVYPGSPKTTTLFLRIPAWSQKTQVRVNGADRTAGVPPALPEAQPGTYLEISREWKEGDVIEIDFDISVRALRGDRHVGWKTSLYKGPLLLAYDQMYNEMDPADIPELDLAALKLEPAATTGIGQFEPITALRATAPDGKSVTLVDFATAGAHGTRYETWLPVRNAPAAPFSLENPETGALLSPEDLAFSWGALPEGTQFELVVAHDPELKDLVHRVGGITGTTLGMEGIKLEGDRPYYWQVTARAEGQETRSLDGPRVFTVDPSQPSRTKGAVLRAPLQGTAAPVEGKLAEERDLSPVAGPGGTEKGALAFNGTTSKLVYETPGFPLRAYTLAAWFRAESPDAGYKNWQEIACAWYAGSNDALRVAVQGGELVARIEQPGGCYQTPGVPVEAGRWTHVALVKDGKTLRLHIDGKEAKSIAVPELLNSDPKKLGIGCNPLFSDIEGFHGAISGVTFLRQAVGADEIRGMAENK
jgi:hypothetical protein